MTEPLTKAGRELFTTARRMAEQQTFIKPPARFVAEMRQAILAIENEVRPPHDCVAAEAEIERLTALVDGDHDINCGIDPLRLGEDIGCTCYLRDEVPDQLRLHATMCFDGDCPECMTTPPSKKVGAP